MTASYGSFKVFDNDDSIFASINGDDLKKEVAKNVKSVMKTDTVDIFITGRFRNANVSVSCASLQWHASLIGISPIIKDT